MTSRRKVGAFPRHFVAIFVYWIVLQLAIGPIAFVNSKIPIPVPIADAMERTVFLPTWIAAKIPHCEEALITYVRLWIPAPEGGWCGLELHLPDAVVDQEPWLRKRHAIDEVESLVDR